MNRNLHEYRVLTAAVSPMNDDSSINYTDYETVLRQQEAAGNGIVLLGSTGEGANLDEHERTEIANFALSLKLRVPLIVGVGGLNLNAQLAWVKKLNETGIDGYLLVMPLYAKPDTNGQIGWFTELLDASDKPCIIYNVPSRAGKSIDFETIEAIASHKNFWGMKESSGSVEEFKKYQEAAGPSAHMLSGDDNMLPAFAKEGASGVVSVAANVWPKATSTYAEQCINDSFTGHETWRTATEALFCTSNPVPAKALMAERESISSPAVRLPLSASDLPGIEIMQNADQAIAQWLDEQSL